MPDTTVLIATGAVVLFLKKHFISLLTALICLLLMGAVVTVSRRDRIRRAYAQRLIHRINRHESLSLKQWNAFLRLTGDGIIAHEKETNRSVFVSIPELQNTNRGSWIGKPSLA